MEYSSIDKMTKYDCHTFRNYVAFLHGRMAPGTRRPHHDSELISCYHDAFLTWGHYHNNIVLFYHDSPITRSHFMDPTDRAIKGFYCSSQTPRHLHRIQKKCLVLWICDVTDDDKTWDHVIILVRTGKKHNYLCTVWYKKSLSIIATVILIDYRYISTS